MKARQGPSKVYGWIAAPLSDRDKLVRVGVKIGKWCKRDGRFEDCAMSQETARAIADTMGYAFHLRRGGGGIVVPMRVTT